MERKKKMKLMTCALILALMASLTGPVELPDSSAKPRMVVQNDDEGVTYKLNKKSIKLSPGKTRKLKMKIKGSVSGQAVSVKWKSSKTTVATVDSAGVVRGENVGSANVHARVFVGKKKIGEETCQVTVKAKSVSYTKMKSNMYKGRTKFFSFMNDSSVQCNLTMFGGLWRSFRIKPTIYNYDGGLDTVSLWPKIVAKKTGSTTQLSLDIKLQTVVNVRAIVKRKYKTITFSGAGKKVKITGSTTSHGRQYSGSTQCLTKTQGTFRISKNSKTHLTWLDRLEKILKAKNTKIRTKDVANNKNYEIKPSDADKKSMIKLIEKYKSLLKYYWA